MIDVLGRLLTLALGVTSRPRNAVARTVGRSVFRRVPKEASMEVLLVALFHRSSATLYAIYSLWAVVSLTFGIPSLISANGELWQALFSVLTLVTAAPAAFGATFWPVFARLEALAGSSFIGLIAVYTATIFYNAMTGEGPWAGVVIILSVLVMPVCRTIVVIVLLVRQSKDERRVQIEAQKIAIREEIATVTAATKKAKAAK